MLSSLASSFSAARRTLWALSAVMGFWASWVSMHTSAQGLVNFRADVDVRIVEGFRRVGGSNYLAELLAAPAAPSDAPFAAVGLPTPLDALGQINGGLRIASNVPPGENARLMIRIWDSQGGTILGYGLAPMRGQSEVVVARLAFPDGPHQSEFPPPTLFSLSSIGLAYHPAPDPCECELEALFTDSVGTGFKSSFGLLGISGDGSSVLLRTDDYSQSPFGYTYRYGFGLLFSSDAGIQSLVSSENFNPFEPGAPSRIQPRWIAATLTFDGRTTVGTHQTIPEPQSRLLSPGRTPVAIPLAFAAGISGNGRFAVGKTKSLDWVRIDLQHANSPPDIILEEALSTDLSRLIGISKDGETITWEAANSSQPLGRWTKAQGFRYGGPKGLRPKSVSSDGTTVVGQIPTNGLNRAAFWSELGGLVLLGPANRSSVATGVSGDGAVQIGFVADGKGNQVVVWSNHEPEIRISNLVRGVDLRPLEDNRYDLESDVAFLSDDAQIAVFSGTSISAPDIHKGFRARIAFPGTIPRIYIQGKGAERSLRFIGKSGYHYQILTSRNLSDWTPWKPVFFGSNTPVTVPIESGDPKESFFKYTLKLLE